MVAKGVRAIHDEALQNYMQTEAENIYENDALSFVEPAQSGNDYKSKLR